MINLRLYIQIVELYTLFLNLQIIVGGAGGFDIFYSKQNPETNIWDEPKNIGYPINSEESEESLIVSVDGRYGYFSSTSVYGNYDGNWVDENSKLLPKTSRGLLRKKSEINHLNLFKLHSLPIHIFRLPGIYGPGRSVFDKIRNGQITEIIKKTTFFLVFMLKILVQLSTKA